MKIQVLQDDAGNNTGIFIPYNDWKKLKKQHKDLEELESISNRKAKKVEKELKKAVNEVNLAIKGKVKLQSAKDFLNEL